MKIVFTADGIYAYASCGDEAVGGAERQQWYLARALAARGWKVVVGTREGVPHHGRRRIDGVEFVAPVMPERRYELERSVGADDLGGPLRRLAVLEGPDAP